MTASMKKEVAAEALVDAMFTTDQAAVQKYGISTKTLQRYRKQLAGGYPELSAFVHTKNAARSAAWADCLPSVLENCLRALEACFAAVQSDPEALKRPDIIFALSGA
jgi:hypothetical protein